MKARMAKAGKGQGMKAQPAGTKDTSALVALTDIPKDGDYKGQKGGLYPNCSNERPAAHTKAGEALAKQIKPLDASGKASSDGKIVFLTIGFSNTSKVSQGFIDVAGKDKTLNPHLVIVNGAEGGHSAFMVKNPDDNAVGTEYWKQWVPTRLKDANVTADQVEAIWLKQTEAPLGPGQLKKMGVDAYDSPLVKPFPQGAQDLEKDMEQIVRVMPRFFPNLKLCYVSSRSYGGWSVVDGITKGNNEPWSYETGFSVKWLIEKQLKGDAALNFDPKKGKVVAPWMSWGAYIWANGERKRKDGYSYAQSDYMDTDHMHESAQGMQKVGHVMVDFFKNDPTSKSWFLAK
jgi:hypothetical protein